MNNPLIISTLLGELFDKLERIKHFFYRGVQFPDAPGKIKVAIGMRRAGKTYLIYQTILELMKKGIPKTSILYINFEDDRLYPLDQSKLAALVDAFFSLYPENHERKCYLFFDEIQNVTDWSLVIRRLYDSKNVEVFLTGSSAKLLSKEIATSLRGRSLSTEVWPLSFLEFRQAKKIEIEEGLYDIKTQDKLKAAFFQYLSLGGFPEVTHFPTEVLQKILQEYIDLVIYRDIIERYEIKNPSVIKYMILSIIHNVGSQFSVNKFYDDLRSRGYSIGKDILYEYTRYIEDAYLAFFVSKYEHSFRKSSSAPKKTYAIDSGICRAVTLDYENNLGHLFENVVFLDLKRLGYQVSYYKTVEGYEVDFIAQTVQGRKKFFQVVWNMDDPKTMEREERALKAAMAEMKDVDGELVTLHSYLRKGIVRF